MKQAVLLLAHGAPERLEDVESYLSFVRSGRPGSSQTAPPQIVEEVRHRYAAIGGSSPLLGWTRAQSEALAQLLGIPVFFGMRNWHPFIRETMDQIRDARVDRILAICLAPQYSELSVGLYIKRTEEAKREAGVLADVVWAKSFHAEPLLVEAFAEKLAGGDPYDREARETAAAVAANAGLSSWDFAYQSQGMTNDRWLGPTVESCLERYADQGVREVVLHPIGFVCDHVEILFDIDIAFRDYAAARGITLFRPESLNGSPVFTAALGAVARRCLK